jgi:hypothetical protein
VYAIAHRWQPERLFVFIYTGYLDESGTHDDSTVTIMGGILARAQHWRPYEIEFDEIRGASRLSGISYQKVQKRHRRFQGLDRTATARAAEGPG